MEHKSVLLQEVMQYLDPKEGEVVVDATVGSGGHSEAICGRIGATGRLVAIDLDEDAIARSKKRLAHCSAHVSFALGHAKELEAVLDREGVQRADKFLFDLGISTPQLEEPERGMSIKNDGPLLMTFAKHPTEEMLTAKEIVNSWAEESIADIIYGYGGETAARKIAHAIVEARRKGEITRTSQLAEIIEKAVPRRGKIHPATKTFMALRIVVNDEMEGLKRALQGAVDRSKPKGRIAVITFHSTEDRIVKHFFKNFEKQGAGTVITKKPIVPTREEVAENPRARSAKLRVFEREAYE